MLSLSSWPGGEWFFCLFVCLPPHKHDGVFLHCRPQSDGTMTVAFNFYLHWCSVSMDVSARVSYTLELELQTRMNCHVGAGI